MSRITEEIDIDVPVRVAYDQWTQFESFPRFMEGIDRVVQLDDTTLEWTATIAGAQKRWRAEILEQRPDQLVAWRSIDGARNNGSVRFEAVSPRRTRIALTLDIEPEGPIETAGDALGIVERRIKGDLERFRDFIESNGQPTGGWRGVVHAGSTVSSPSDRSRTG